MACALGHKACREDFSVAYHRVPRLFATLALARGDGRYGRILKQLAKTDLLILDDWGPEKLNDDQRRDVLEIIEDRYERRSFTTPIASISPGKHAKTALAKSV
nr:ATP-binding protein [Mesorhizobium sp.]